VGPRDERRAVEAAPMTRAEIHAYVKDQLGDTLHVYAVNEVVAPRVADLMDQEPDLTIEAALAQFLEYDDDVHGELLGDWWL
jgi:hypothetical protein